MTSPVTYQSLGGRSLAVPFMYRQQIVWLYYFLVSQSYTVTFDRKMDNGKRNLAQKDKNAANYQHDNTK